MTEWLRDLADTYDHARHVAWDPGTCATLREVAEHLDNLDERLHRTTLSLSKEVDARTRWQPIETAPHSGIAVLLWQPWKSARDCTIIGHYANGWVDRFIESLQPEPTHWMPLPEPPT